MKIFFAIMFFILSGICFACYIFVEEAHNIEVFVCCWGALIIGSIWMAGVEKD